MLEKWTSADQEKLDALTAKKAAFENTYGGRLEALCARVFPPSLDPPYIAMELRRHADSFNDALAPFDSGVRAAAGG